MIKEFVRATNDENIARESEELLRHMQELLSYWANGLIRREDQLIFINSLIEKQDENGFWGLIPTPNVDSDIRVYYWYQPTYIATALMMKYVLVYPEEMENIPHYKEVLQKGLEACTKRRLLGSGYDQTAGLLDALEIFAKGDVRDFTLKYADLCPDFKKLIEEHVHGMIIKVVLGKTQGEWGEDYYLRMQGALARLGYCLPRHLVEKRPIGLFVYGTLMKGQCNHESYLSDAYYIGKFNLKGFALYDLGGYPGIKETYSNDQVKGEVYQIDGETLNRIEKLEGEGYLYKRKEVSAYSEGSAKEIRVYVYTYNKEVEKANKISVLDQPWRQGMLDETLIWYAAYGSNLLIERFNRYITGGTCKLTGAFHTGCQDITLAREVKRVCIPYERYYGNESSRWNQGGVAFLDPNKEGKTHGKMYLITKGQLKEIWEQEGKYKDWYNQLLYLGVHGDIPVVTFTNSERRVETKPSPEYLKVIKAGEKEMRQIKEKEIRLYR